MFGITDCSVSPPSLSGKGPCNLPLLLNGLVRPEWAAVLVFLLVEVLMKISFLMVAAVANVCGVIQFTILYHPAWILDQDDKVKFRKFTFPSDFFVENIVCVHRVVLPSTWCRLY